MRATCLPRPQGRGPIEACRWPRPCRRPAAFHGRKVVAPLDHVRHGVLGTCGQAFHGRKVAAPLKREYRLVNLGTPLGLPRPQGRGPIEASAFSGCFSASSPFHGRKAVAPLKPAAVPHNHRGRLGLPRPQGRGPIEASQRVHGRRQAQAFHGRKAVAPLKPPAYLHLHHEDIRDPDLVLPDVRQAGHSNGRGVPGNCAWRRPYRHIQGRHGDPEPVGRGRKAEEAWEGTARQPDILQAHRRQDGRLGGDGGGDGGRCGGRRGRGCVGQEGCRSRQGRGSRSRRQRSGRA